jgi:hypothetical protein
MVSSRRMFGEAAKRRSRGRRNLPAERGFPNARRGGYSLFGKTMIMLANSGGIRETSETAVGSEFHRRRVRPPEAIFLVETRTPLHPPLDSPLPLTMTMGISPLITVEVRCSSGNWSRSRIDAG